MLGCSLGHLWSRVDRRAPLRRVLPHAKLFAVNRERLAGESLRPLETEFIHKRLAALARTLAEGTARRQRLLQHRANRRVHGAQEELEVRRALHFNERVELVHLQPRVLLVRVAEEVGHDGLVVRDVRA